MAKTLQNAEKAARPVADVRFIGDISGCYRLSSRNDLPDDHVKVFACRTRSISTQQAVVSAPVVGERGESLIVKFDGLGILRATVQRETPDGFVMAFEQSEKARQKLAAKVDWLKKRALLKLEEKREHKRILPREPRSTLVLAGNKTLDCFIVDMSSSGAAISADISTTIGMPLAVGAVLGRVVRHMEYGFAVQFTEPQDLNTLETLLTALQPGRRQVLAEALARGADPRGWHEPEEEVADLAG